MSSHKGGRSGKCAFTDRAARLEEETGFWRVREGRDDHFQPRVLACPSVSVITQTLEARRFKLSARASSDKQDRRALQSTLPFVDFTAETVSPMR